MKEEKRKEWVLDDEFKLIESSGGWTLEYKSKTPYQVKKKGVYIDRYDSSVSFHGVLYQALQSYVHKKAGKGTWEDLKNIKTIIEDIDSVLGQIEEKYKIVKVSGGSRG